MLLIFVFLVGAVMSFGFGIWSFVASTFLLIVALAIWQLVLEATILDAFVVIVTQTVALQAGYFFGLLIAYLRARAFDKQRSDVTPSASSNELPSDSGSFN